MIKVLFVCMGNICRSPTAEGVFRELVKQRQLLEFFTIDSAGTHSYHIGASPDNRSQETALTHGVDISDLRARKVDVADFEHFDYIVAMDEANYSDLQHASPARYTEKLSLFMQYALAYDAAEVPDPYYGGAAGFKTVFDMATAAAIGLLDHIVEQHGLPQQQ